MAELLAASQRADCEGLLESVERVAELDAPLALRLRQFVECFDYTSLQTLLSSGEK